MHGNKLSDDLAKTKSMTEIQELHGKNGAADVAKTRRMEEMLCKIG